MNHYEDGEQMAVVSWLRAQFPKVRFTTCPANFKLRPQQARRMVLMGYSAGTPDLMLFAPRGGYAALFIEMKAPGRKQIGKDGVLKTVSAGRTSPEQDAFLFNLNHEGYKAVVCAGSEAAIEVIKAYMAAEPVAVAKQEAESV